MGEGGRLRLNPTQIVAGALAAVSAAVAASFIGVYGTIVGAGLMSVVYTVGSTLYEHYIHRSKVRLKEARVTGVPTGVVARVRAGSGIGMIRVPAGAWTWTRAQLSKPGWWKPIGALSLLVFAIAILTITLVEAGLGKPMSAALTGQEASGGTSIRVAASGGGSGSDGSRNDDPGRQDGPEHRDDPDQENAPAPSTEPTQQEDTSKGTPEEPEPAPAPEESGESEPSAPSQDPEEEHQPAPEPPPE